MPRKHVHVKGTAHQRNYPGENMENALIAVINDGWSFGQAAEYFDVRKSTLYEKYRGRHSDKLGRPPVLSVPEEKQMVAALEVAANFYYPFTQQDLKLFIKQYLDKKGVAVKAFTNNMPGEK